MEHFTPADGYERRAYARAVQAAREAIRAEWARADWSQGADRAREEAHSAAVMTLRKAAVFSLEAADDATQEAREAEA